MGFKYVLLIVIFLTLIIPLSAQDMRFTGEQNQIVDVTETCTFNDLPCPATFDCNLTIENPEQNIVILNQGMTRNDTIYNYTLNESQTSALGIYEVKQVYCTDGNENGSSSFFFRITSTGAEPIDSGKGLAIIGTFFILVVAIIFFLIFGIFTKNTPFKIFFVSFSLLLMIATIGFSVATLQQVLGTFASLVTAYGQFYILLTILLAGGAIGLIVYLVVMALKSLDSTRHYFKQQDFEE